MKLYELVIEDMETDEVFAISLVEAPAIESDFVYFNKEEVRFAQVDSEQKMLIGPILIPDKKILRIDGEGNPYHVFFTKETVKRLAENYLMKKYTDSATMEHGDRKIKGVHLVQSWVKDGKLDKSNNYGMALPEGSWVGMFKITDDKLWNDYVKTGKVQGFSIEGLFGHQLVNASQEIDLDKDIEDLTETEANILLGQIKSLISEKKGVQLESYNDYPQSATNNAKRALAWVEKNGWGSCGTPVGKQRANQLANREKISRDTIARMSAFKRHQDDKDVPYGEGCGGLMWDCWGGTSGIEWAANKLKEIDLAEVGPRGGIKESPKAPKSDTKNPDPKGEGTAKGDASGKSAKVSAEDEKTLQNKVDDFNKKESNTKNGRATLGQLKSVFQRGLGAFNTSHSPVIKSASAWAFARVNAYLYLLKNGRPENPKYTTDYDLLPKGHPKADTKLKEGVPHYTADGKLWEGPTHKGPDGRLMTGETHTEDSEYLYHKEDLEAQPSFPGGSYAGEPAKKKKYISPALIGNDK